MKRSGICITLDLLLIIACIAWSISTVMATVVCQKCKSDNRESAPSCVECGANLELAGQIYISPTDGKEMVLVPAGEFLMGSSEEDKEADNRDWPQRKVYLDAYWIDKTEVTVAEYRKYCQATGRAMPKAPSWGWKDDHPIVNVHWEEAALYAHAVGKRLPTEAEWEKAARGTNGRKYPWGNAEPNANGRWRCNLIGSDDGYENTAPVGSFPLGASPYGCLDMAGNVWEWCSDIYSSEYYARNENRNPKGPSSESWGALTPRPVVRGGSWDFQDGDVRCAFRFNRYPFSQWKSQGFRCVKPKK